MAGPMPLSCPVRLAREDEPGQYVVHHEEAILRVDHHTLSLLAPPTAHGCAAQSATGQGAVHSALFHTTLRSTWLGLGENKLMVVPFDRGCASE